MNILSRIVNRMVRTALPFTNLGLGQEAKPKRDILLENFYERTQKMNHPRVLELGTKRSQAERSTRHDSWVPHASEYLGTDIENGLDVDLVADIHQLTRVTGEEQFDIIISASTFEHFKYPHLAAHEIMKALRIGGLLYIQTHQSYGLHGYPHDYFRFSREALAGLFGNQMGFHVIMTQYLFAARICSPRLPELINLPTFLNVYLLGEKIDKTPATYVFELDTV